MGLIDGEFVVVTVGARGQGRAQAVTLARGIPYAAPGLNSFAAFAVIRAKVPLEARHIGPATYYRNVAT